MASKRASGASTSTIIRTRRRKLQRNTAPCPMCGAGKGQPCFKSIPGRGLRDLPRTHLQKDAKHA